MRNKCGMESQLSKKTHLYRHYDGNGELLYIGISLSAVQRLSQHMSGSNWADEIASIEVEYYPDRDAALRAEKAAIEAEQPRYNITYNRTSVHAFNVPDEFNASFNDGGWLVPQAIFDDVEGDPLVVSFDEEMGVKIDTSGYTYISLSREQLISLSEMLDRAVWLTEKAPEGETDQAFRALAHLPNSPVPTLGRFMKKCHEHGCDMMVPV